MTKNRKGPAFAKMVARIGRAYPGKKTIHLAMDNLSTHGEKSLTDYYGEKLGGKIWEKFTPHCTPKHASWLDQAEIEIGIFSRQCLGKDRIGDIPALRRGASASNRRMNRQAQENQLEFHGSGCSRKIPVQISRLHQVEVPGPPCSG